MRALLARSARMTSGGPLSAPSLHALSGLASQVTISGANFLTTIILVRAMGLTEFGRFSVCFLLMMLTRNLLDAALLAPMSTIGPKLSASSRRAYRGFLLANLALLILTVSLVLALFVHPLGALMGAPWLPQLVWPMIGANAAAHVADFVRRHHFLGDRPLLGFLVDALRFTLQTGLLLVLLLMAKDSLDPAQALNVCALAALAGAIPGFLFYGRTGWSRRLARSAGRRHAQFVGWMAPAVMLDSLKGMLPFFIATGLLGEAVIGLTRTMQVAANLMNLPLNALQQIAPGRAATLLKKGGRAAVAAYAARLMRLSLAFSCMAILLIAVLGQWAVGVLFKVHSPQAAFILGLFLFANMLALIKYVLSVELTALEITAPNMAAALIGIVIAWAGTQALALPLGAMVIPVMAVTLNLAYIAVLLVALRRSKVAR